AVLVWVSRVPVMLFLRQIKPFVWLMAVTVILHLFLTEGTTLYRLPYTGLTISREGVSLGLFFSLRLLLLIALSLVLMFTTAPTDMTDGFEDLLRPLRRIGVPTDRYALMLGISFRFIPILFEEADRIQKAQVSRGAHFGGNIISRMYNVASVVIPLFISVFHRAEALSLALEARGFTTGVRRTYYRELHFRRADIFAFFIVSIITAGVFIL
ncbi:unnamed protein product, partial [marine sediment metagenome]